VRHRVRELSCSLIYLSMDTQTTTLRIQGTHCESCKALIEEVASEIPGVVRCTVNFQTGATTVEHNAPVDWQQFTQAIEALGNYRVPLPA